MEYVPHSAPAPNSRGVGGTKRIVRAVLGSFLKYSRASVAESHSSKRRKAASWSCRLRNWVCRSLNNSFALTLEGSWEMAKVVGKCSSRSSLLVWDWCFRVGDG